ncbi:coil containing protein [Vibrio phage 1.238.A._10N.261.52.F10]|uniref:Coil containing protein n=2 Tax=Pariacacavirus TaxID=2948856 RepID=A0A2I7RUG8_9CAUD|nr:DNA primase [Vibrio phage 1.238.A._10N.261.52.F10]YP_010093495.1 DNA primase [Vibrio phage 1.245.O._10N.261.54.C7]AUR97297.1 coil containing protein [Vibrio phage 1.238.A._10N.261.52.F10]AUR97391.1 coil containing protein [Vibrio phage 1.238.B._10N.261.52.F10]AUR97965.1 coil containing protein [Vibrio phage 1.245.O._10N.261.54.C7]
MELRPYEDMQYHPTQEKILAILRTKTQNLESDTYFRGIIAFYLAQMASSVRAHVNTPHRGKLPINMFVCGLMSSGAGKGFSMNIMERELVNGFSETYRKETFPFIAEQSIANEARKKAIRNATDEAEETEALNTEFKSLGAMPYSFDSGTAPAYKQIRTKAQIAKSGSLNLIIDEIGTNLLSNAELFAVSLEAYDLGLIKQKITKNSTENKRSEERHDPVPSNMMVFGTPSKLFNGGMEEREFRSLLETGYGRRFLYGWGNKTTATEINAEDLYELLTHTSNDKDIGQLHTYFKSLADAVNHDKIIEVPKAVALINLQYQLNCEQKASKISDFEPIRKAELQHRYFKAMKLAGAYAFVDQTPEVTEEQMYSAIKLVEDSGVACEQILSQDKNYVRLAKYIAAVDKECTYADLVEDLPFFTGSKSAKDDMVSLARAWAHRNNIVIKKYLDDGFEILKGETLTETDLDKLIFSASNDVAYHYMPSDSEGLIKVRAWDNFHRLVTHKGVHWCNHNFMEKHRCKENAIPEFNMVVLDVDDGVSLETAQLLLKDYEALFYTTKSHQIDKNGVVCDRFRVVLPIKYHLKMNDEEFKEFMGNIFDWLPFKVDDVTGQRARKWEAFNGSHEYQHGTVLDPTQFIPKTAKNEKYVKEVQDLGDMDKIESWFARSIGEGNRNNTLARFSFMLYDSGLAPADVEDAVIKFNDKLKNPLSKDELKSTVIKSLWGKAASEGRI